MKKNGKGISMKEWVMFITGTALMAFAINRIFAPADMVTGGVSGLAIVLEEGIRRWLNVRIPIWVFNAVLNVPLFILGFCFLGRRSMKRSLIGTVALTFFLALIPEEGIGLDDSLLTAVFGGVISGVGIGLVFSANGSTGGTDLAALILTKRFRTLKVTQLLLVLDGVIVLAGAWMFGLVKALYAVIAIYTVSVVSDRVLKGLYDAMAIFVISKDSRKIADQIMGNLGRGVTRMKAMGGYSGQEKEMLFCVIGKRQLPQTKDIIAEVDSKAFVIVTEANEVLGEGFRNIVENGEEIV